MIRSVSAMRTALYAVVGAIVIAVAAVLPAIPAHAAAQVSVSTAPSSTSPTEVTLSGTGFQYQPNAPGGVYVFFGAVSDPSGNSWKPSQGGSSGQTFAYAGTSGAQLLVAFEGGDSADAANGMIRSDGTWSAQMRIPGSTFEATFGNPHDGQDQQGSTIDCKVVQCGIITIGAHGMWNANNESFTPVNFDGVAPTESFDDEALVLELPDQPGEGDDTSAAPAPTDESDEAGEEQPEESAVAEDVVAVDEAAGSSAWIFIVLGIAAAVLLGAIVFLIVRSRKVPPTSAAGAAPTPDEAQNHTAENDSSGEEQS